MPQPVRTIAQWLRDREREAPLDKKLAIAGLPERYRTKSWDDYEDAVRTSDDESLRSILRDYVKHWPTEDGVVLLGPAGTGKTFGASLLAIDVIEAGGWVRFSTWTDLVKRKINLITLNQRALRDDDWQEHDREELLIQWIEQDCDLLILDDVGKEHRTAGRYADDELDNLLRRRWDKSKATVLTSNLRLDEWETYNSSMVSFMWEVGEVLSLTRGKDFRVARRGRG